MDEDDEVLEDMEPRFDASTTVAVQNFMEDTGFPIPESSKNSMATDEVDAYGRCEDLRESNSPQRKIQQFFQPRSSAESDDDAPEYDWKYYATWSSTSEKDQQPVCLTPDDDTAPEIAGSPWEQSVLAKLITGPRPDSPETDHSDGSGQSWVMRERSELSPPRTIR